MGYEISDIQGIPVVSPMGRLNVTEVIDWDNAMHNLITEGAEKMIVNFAKLEYISSNELRVLLSTKRKLKEKDGDLVLAGLSPQVKKVIEITELNNAFRVFRDLNAAAAHFGGS